MKYHALALAVALMTSQSATAQDETTIWAEFDGWDVSYYPAQAGCMASTQFQSGTIFFIGYDFSIAEPTLDIILMDERWKSIEAEKEYPIKLYFGDETPWNATMTGRDFDGLPGLTLYQDAFSDEAELFVTEFRRELSMDYQFKGRSLGNYPLRGSTKAMDAVTACQEHYNDASNHSASDPFASPTSETSSDDPFAL